MHPTLYVYKDGIKFALIVEHLYICVRLKWRQTQGQQGVTKLMVTTTVVCLIQPFPVIGLH